MPLTKAQIESAARGGNQSDMRAVLSSLHADIQNLQAATGTSTVRPTDDGQTSAQSPPSAPQFSASGANGTCALTITPASTSVPATVYYEVSYSASQSFSSGVTTMPSSAATSASIDTPGQTLFFRLRASFDQKTWSPYRTQPSAVDAGLQTSAATSPNIPLNQSNAATIDSIAVGGVVYIRIYGAAGGVGTPWVNTAGKVFPSASLVGNMPGATAYVAYDPDAAMYRVKYRLSDVFPDGYVIVGQTSVVTTTPPMLPTIIAYEVSGGILGFGITNGGSGITAPLTLTIHDPDSFPGSGATAGAQTIEGGVLKSIAPGAPGHGYSSDTTVTASGGLASQSTAGGGGTGGTNGGRLTNV